MAGCEADSHLRDASTESGAFGVVYRAFRPHATYRPETDSLQARHSLWNQVGGIEIRKSNFEKERYNSRLGRATASNVSWSARARRVLSLASPPAPLSTSWRSIP